MSAHTRHRLDLQFLAVFQLCSVAVQIQKITCEYSIAYAEVQSEAIRECKIDQSQNEL